MGLFDNMDEKKLQKMRETEFITRRISNAGDSNLVLLETIDKKTGISYIWGAVGTAGGLTARLNKDGTPMIADLSELD